MSKLLSIERDGVAVQALKNHPQLFVGDCGELPHDEVVAEDHAVGVRANEGSRSGIDGRWNASTKVAFPAETGKGCSLPVLGF
jgi:hypothetical protein